MQDRMTRAQMWVKDGAEANPGIMFQAIDTGSQGSYFIPW